VLPGDEGGDEGVDRGEVGVVPRGDDEDDTHRFAGEVAAEFVAVLDHLGGEGLGRDVAM
jgi:hypothetical protein